MILLFVLLLAVCFTALLLLVLRLLVFLRVALVRAVLLRAALRALPFHPTRSQVGNRRPRCGGGCGGRPDRDRAWDEHPGERAREGQRQNEDEVEQQDRALCHEASRDVPGPGTVVSLRS